MGVKYRYELGTGELKVKQENLLKALLAEFIGIFIINFFACGSCTQLENGSHMAFGFGLSVFIAITAIGHISGGHINPAVTIGMLTVGRISLLRSILYIIVQCAGAIAGTSALKALLPEEYHNGLGHTMLAKDITELQGTGIEYFLGLLLVLTVFGACDENKPETRGAAPLAIGLSVALGHIGTIKYTGASMNPARTLGTAVASGIWTSHWVYWVGPILGGITAALLYTLLFESPITTIESSGRYKHNNEGEMQKLESGRDYA